MGARHRDVPRVDDDADLALGLVGGEDLLATAEPHLRQAVAGAPRRPVQQVRAGERSDERVARAGDELRGARELAHLPFDDHPDLVRERGGVLVVVGDEQRGEAEPAEQLAQLASHLRLRVRVECGERLVEQQHRRVSRERAGEGDALLLAAGELARIRAGEVRDVKALEQLVDALAPRVGDVRRAR